METHVRYGTPTPECVVSENLLIVKKGLTPLPYYLDGLEELHDAQK